MIKNDSKKTLFKATPLLSLNPRYLELKFQYINYLFASGVKELNEFKDREHSLRNRLIQNIVNLFEYTDNHTQQANKAFQLKSNLSIKTNNLLRKSDKTIKKSDVRTPDFNITQKSEIAENREFVITVTDRELAHFGKSNKSKERDYESDFSEDLLPIYVHKNSYGPRPDLPKNIRKTSFMGPLGFGFPFNNFTTKTYLFGNLKNN